MDKRMNASSQKVGSKGGNRGGGGEGRGNGNDNEDWKSGREKETNNLNLTTLSYVTSSLVTSCDNYVCDGQQPHHKSHKHLKIKESPLDSGLKQPMESALTPNVGFKVENQDVTTDGSHVFSQDNLKIQSYEPHWGATNESKHQNNKIKGKKSLNTQGQESVHTRNTGQQKHDKIAVIQSFVPQDLSRANKEINLEDPAESISLRGTVSRMLPLQTSKKGSKNAMVLACWFPFWRLAAKTLKINIQWIILKDLKWQQVIRKLCPGIQTM